VADKDIAKTRGDVAEDEPDRDRVVRYQSHIPRIEQQTVWRSRGPGKSGINSQEESPENEDGDQVPEGGNRPQRIGVYRAPNITAAKIKATPHRPIISKGGTQALRCCAAANRHSRGAGNRRIVRKPHRLAAFLSPGVPSARLPMHTLSAKCDPKWPQ
jgi:hypothetical protein